MNKDDRNTAIIVILVLVVCTISLVAIAGSLWSIVAPGVNGVLSFIGFNVKLANANYNFQIPSVAQLTPPSPQPVEQGNSGSSDAQSPNVVRSFDYNFRLPATGIIKQGEGYRDAILYDAQTADTSTLPSTLQIIGTLVIPKLSMNVAVVSSQDPTVGLETGMWVYPNSNQRILLCFRNFFSQTDSRSCRNLDKLEVGDQAWWQFTNEVQTSYRVVGINTFSTTDTSVYSLLDEPGYLKLVTTTPLGSNAKRLVVLLQKS